MSLLSPLVRLARWAQCILGAHDIHSWCNGFESAGPPEGHVCAYVQGDSVDVSHVKFEAWVRLRCRRCAYTFPAVVDWPGFERAPCAVCHRLAPLVDRECPDCRR